MLIIKWATPGHNSRPTTKLTEPSSKGGSGRSCGYSTFVRSQIEWSGSKKLQTTSLVLFRKEATPLEHVLMIKNQMTIICVDDSLKCKLMMDTLNEAALCWYMGLPKHFVTSYQDLAKKIIHQFSASKHRKVSMTSLFNVPTGAEGKSQWILDPT